MSTKIIYFVRHGESELNAKGIRQGAEGPLSAKGREQVLATAKKFPHHRGKPDVIIASPYQRTRETAEIIAKELGMDIEYSDLLVERRNPSQIVGKHKDDPEVKHITDLIDSSYHDDNFRYSDEENFLDLRDRAKKLLEYIDDRPEKHILMVTHGIFLKMVVAFILLGKKLTAREHVKLSYLNPINNAGLTICTCTTRFLRNPKWELLLWNDELKEDQNVK